LTQRVSPGRQTRRAVGVSMASNTTLQGGTDMSEMKIQPEVPSTSVNKSEKTKTEEERTS